VKKTVASATQSAKCFFFTLIHVQLLVSSCARTNKTSYKFLTNCHISIFSYKLRTDKEHLRLTILKKLRTASLNSKFTGSYKKSVMLI